MLIQERLIGVLLEYLDYVLAACEHYVKRLMVLVSGAGDLTRPIEQTVQVIRSYPLRLCLFYQHANASAKQKLTPYIHLQELSDRPFIYTFYSEVFLSDDGKLRRGL